jgi:hypothetical protein
MHGLKYKLNMVECGMNWVTFLILDFYHSSITKKVGELQEQTCRKNVQKHVV